MTNTVTSQEKQIVQHNEKIQNSELIYQNFDKLEVCFQGAFPENIIEMLKVAKEEAQQRGQPIVVKLGRSDEEFKVLAHGLGGFTLGFLTMDEGLQLSTQCSHNKELWNIFIGARSLHLALNGYVAAKAQMLQILDDLGAKTIERLCPYTGELTIRPLESVRRIDYCLDFSLPVFVPDRHCVVYHQSGKMAQEAIWFIKKNQQGLRDNALTIGQRNRRVIQIYDKALEVRQKNNLHWHKIWGKKPEECEDIWRIEVRLFKNYMRDLGLRTFYDVDHHLANIIQKTFDTVKYTVPQNDSNRSRWPVQEFWRKAAQSAFKALEYSGCDLVPEAVHAMQRARALKAIESMLPGLMMSYTVLQDLPFTGAMDAFKRFESDFKALLHEAPDKLLQKYHASQKRYASHRLSK